jgi:GntR family transcriptional regulator
MNNNPQKTRRKPRASPAPGSGGAGERLVPLHYQVYMQLRRRLLQGEFAPSEPMPGELEMSRQFQVSRVTLRRTLARLEEEGLVVRRHGIGTFPGDLGRNSSASAAPVGSLRESVVGPEDERLRLRLVGFDLLPPPPFLGAGRVSFGRRVLRVRRLSLHGRVPAHFVTSYVPADLASHVDRDALGNRTVLEVLERARVAIGEAEFTLTAAAADVLVAGLLEVPVGSPLLVTQRLTFDPEGRPVEYFEAISRPDEYAFRFVKSGDPRNARRRAKGRNRGPAGDTGTQGVAG